MKLHKSFEDCPEYKMHTHVTIVNLVDFNLPGADMNKECIRTPSKTNYS